MKKERRKKGTGRSQRNFIICGLTPIMILFFVFSVIPIIYSAVMSLFNYNGFPHPPFVGIKNYVMLFHDSEFLGALKNTVFFCCDCCCIEYLYCYIPGGSGEIIEKNEAKRIFQRLVLSPSRCSYGSSMLCVADHV